MWRGPRRELQRPWFQYTPGNTISIWHSIKKRWKHIALVLDCVWCWHTIYSHSLFFSLAFEQSPLGNTMDGLKEWRLQKLQRLLIQIAVIVSKISTSEGIFLPVLFFSSPTVANNKLSLVYTKCWMAGFWTEIPLLNRGWVNISILTYVSNDIRVRLSPALVMCINNRFTCIDASHGSSISLILSTEGWRIGSHCVILTCFDTLYNIDCVWPVRRHTGLKKLRYLWLSPSGWIHQKLLTYLMKILGQAKARMGINTGKSHFG